MTTKITPEKLRIIADLLDAFNEALGTNSFGPDIQTEIRGWADGIEAPTDDLVEACKEMLWAANRDPHEGPTGWAQAMSKIASIVFPTEEETT